MRLNNLVEQFKNFKSAVNQITTCLEKVQEFHLDIYRTDVFYNGIIISLYGAFEDFVDSIAEEYLAIVYECNQKIEMSQSSSGEIKHTTNIKSIKEELINRYKENLGEFLLFPRRHSYIENSDESVNQLLSSYLSAKTKQDYSHINKKLLLFHGGNMKSESLFAFLQKLKILDLGACICDRHFFADFLINELAIEREIIKQYSTQPNSDIYLQLNRLVDERNIIAHTGKSENKISFNDLKNKIFPYFILLCDAITRTIVEQVTLNFEFELGDLFVNDEIIAVYNDTIMCHNIENLNVRVDDYFLLEFKNKYKLVKIIGIELNKTKVKFANISNTDYGFEIDDRIKRSYKLVSIVK